MFLFSWYVQDFEYKLLIKLDGGPRFKNYISFVTQMFNTMSCLYYFQNDVD